MGAKRPLKKTKNRRRQKKNKKRTFFCAAILDNFKQKSSYLRPLLYITFPQGFRISKNIGHPTSGSVGKKTVKKDRKPKKTEKVKKKTFFCAAILDNFQTKMFISETTSFHYFSPRIPNFKKWGQKDLKSEQTDRHTDGQTYRRTDGQIYL